MNNDCGIFMGKCSLPFTLKITGVHEGEAGERTSHGRAFLSAEVEYQQQLSLGTYSQVTHSFHIHSPHLVNHGKTKGHLPFQEVGRGKPESLTDLPKATHPGIETSSSSHINISLLLSRVSLGFQDA